jgi:L-threonylcarbamoyladenylate synthase
VPPDPGKADDLHQNRRVPRTTEVLHVDHHRPDPGAVRRAAAILQHGGLVAFPTETVYGLGAVATDLAAVRAVFEAKGRPATDPLIVHGSNREQLGPVVQDWTDAADALARRFWPGPLTMVLTRTAVVPPEVSAGRPTVAVRVPAHPVALALLAATGAPIAAPSANRFGRISPTTAAHVVEELDGRIDLVLDGGPTTLGVESTVVDLTGPVPELLRPGGIGLEDLQAVLGEVRHVERLVTEETRAASGPGQLLRHYAPGTPTVLVDGAAELAEQLVVALRVEGVDAAQVLLPAEVDAAARELYARLRSADAVGAQVLVVSSVESSGLGRAVNDRLFRAAHGRVVLDAEPRTVARVRSMLA